MSRRLREEGGGRHKGFLCSILCCCCLLLSYPVFAGYVEKCKVKEGLDLFRTVWFSAVTAPSLDIFLCILFWHCTAMFYFLFALSQHLLFFLKKHSSIISFTPQVKLHSAGFMRAVDTVALPPLLPHSLYQDFNPRLGKINSNSLLSSYLLHPPMTSSNNPLSGCSLTFQLPFLWLYWLVPLLPYQPTWPALHLDQPGWCEPEVPTVSRGVQKPAAVWAEPPAGPVPSGWGAPLHCFPLLQPGSRGTHSSVRNWALHSSNLLFVLNRKARG